jgi:pectate lyase
VTQNNNYWNNINSRTPPIRFGTGHVFNSYFNTVSDGINTRGGAQVLVESNVFVGSDKPLYNTDSGYAVSVDNDFGRGSNGALAGTLTSFPYSCTKLGHAYVKAAVVGTSGNTLSFLELMLV